MKAENFDELQKKQDELRAERNKLTDEYVKKNTALQEQIDKLDLEKYCADKFMNEYVTISFNDSVVYMYVNNIDRLFNACRFKGFGFITYKEYDALSMYDEIEETVQYSKLNIVDIISKENYYNKRQDIIDKITKVTEHTV